MQYSPRLTERGIREPLAHSRPVGTTSGESVATQGLPNYDRPGAGHYRDPAPMAADAAVAIVEGGAKSTTGTNRDGQCGLVLRVRVGPREMFPR
jgi:hypothetical protein